MGQDHILLISLFIIHEITSPLVLSNYKSKFLYIFQIYTHLNTVDLGQVLIY